MITPTLLFDHALLTTPPPRKSPVAAGEGSGAEGGEEGSGSQVRKKRAQSVETLYDVLCFGNESSLITCQNNNPGSNCSSNHGAVRCAGEIVQGMTDVQQGLIDLEKCLH